MSIPVDVGSAPPQVAAVDYLAFPPFLPSSACAPEDFRGFFLPSLAAFAFAFLAVSLPLPFVPATVGLLPPLTST